MQKSPSLPTTIDEHIRVQVYAKACVQISRPNYITIRVGKVCILISNSAQLEHFAENFLIRMLLEWMFAVKHFGKMARRKTHFGWVGAMHHQQCSAMILPFNLTRLTTNWIKLKPHRTEFNGQHIHSVWPEFSYARQNKRAAKSFRQFSLMLCHFCRACFLCIFVNCIVVSPYRVRFVGRKTMQQLWLPSSQWTVVAIEG